MKIKSLLTMAFLLISGIAFAQNPATEVTDKNLIFGHGKYLQVNSADNAHSIKIIQSGATPTITTDTGALVVTNGISGATTGAHNGTVGATTPSSGSFTALNLSGNFVSTSPTGLGAHKLNGANQACNTSCVGGGCLFGFDLAAGASQPVLVVCSDATADTCLCMQ